MKEYNQIRWVQYPIITNGEWVIRYGLFDVHFIDNAPAHAEPVQVTGLRKAGNEFLKQVRAIQYAGEIGILMCSNPVNYDTLNEKKQPWSGSLIFDHLPILS